MLWNFGKRRLSHRRERSDVRALALTMSCENLASFALTRKPVAHVFVHPFARHENEKVVFPFVRMPRHIDAGCAQRVHLRLEILLRHAIVLSSTDAKNRAPPPAGREFR